MRFLILIQAIAATMDVSNFDFAFEPQINKGGAKWSGADGECQVQSPDDELTVAEGVDRCRSRLCILTK